MGLFSSVRYTPISEDDKQKFIKKKNNQRNVILVVVLAVVVLLGTGYGAFQYGVQYGEAHHNQDNWILPEGGRFMDHTFKYRRAFAERPGNESAAAWKRVFPRGRGFVQHPEIAPEPKGVAVFHQLHCLNALRMGYWAAIDGIEPGHHMEPGHIRHCIDYLRQSIMCGADTNLEPIDPDLGGVTGFGFNRKCRDMVGILHWADKWRTHNQTSSA